MPTLHLGVIDVAYTGSDAKPGVTTGDVATFIEDEYHVMRVFLEMYEEEIGELLANEIAGEIESIAQGKPVGRLSVDVSTGKIGELFRDFLDAREWKQASAQAVAAADDGVNHRKKRPYAADNPARPEFVDTGLYQASFRAWITD
ncbi:MULTISPECIES: hypothetical protein [Pseudomonadota]|uniref:hypothetical protein n=1 Tax=Pseudomonadota TaxID=1224 RepID=UPI001E6E1329|nr:hypothetical protein [Burkholderia contaminans]UEP18773.1 hypothetical protein vBSbQDWS_39 [Shewanella phage vB_Sb_QDWS]UUX38589.1 hypothetical protein NTJ56_07220 [Burkholderia contaminans]